MNPGKDPQGSGGQVMNPLLAGQSQQHRMQLGREQRRQGVPLRGFEHHRGKPRPLCLVMHAVEEDGLADTAQPEQQHASGRIATARPLGRDANGVEQFVAPRELRWRGAGAGSERIVQRTHSLFISELQELSIIDK